MGFPAKFAKVTYEVDTASIIPYPAIVLGFPVRAAKVPLKASVIPYPAIVVGLPVKELNAPSKASVIPYPDNVVGLFKISEKEGV